MTPTSSSSSSSTSSTAVSGGWDRRRLLVTLLAAATAGCVLLAGLGYAIYVAVTSASRPNPPAAVAADVSAGVVADQSVPVKVTGGQDRRDQIAAAPMLPVTPEDSRSGTQAATGAPVIVIPPAGRTGPAGVPTGFPHTPQGAVGQLAAIETTVLQAMSIPQAAAVYDGWAMPGGVGAPGWALTANVQAFLGKTNPGQAKVATTTVVATPVGAQLKGVDGPDWVLACVLLHVRATITSDAAIGYGHCERMQWHPETGSSTSVGGGDVGERGAGGGGGRWMTAPGTPPARAPSTWPGTDASIRAGWRTWAGAGQE